MKNKAIFLDRDGTITVSGDHIHKIEDFRLIPKAAEGLKILQNAGYKLIIITNQAGIGKNIYTKEIYFNFRDYLHNRLKEQGILITAEYFCPHHLGKGIGEYKIDCNCRKPKIGMLEQAAENFDLNLEDCWVIGDNVSDIDAGKKAQCKTIHVLTGEVKTSINYANFVAYDLIEAANYIINKDNNK